MVYFATADLKLDEQEKLDRRSEMAKKIGSLFTGLVKDQLQRAKYKSQEDFIRGFDSNFFTVLLSRLFFTKDGLDFLGDTKGTPPKLVTVEVGNDANGKPVMRIQLNILLFLNDKIYANMTRRYDQIISEFRIAAKDAVAMKDPEGALLDNMIEDL